MGSRVLLAVAGLAIATIGHAGTPVLVIHGGAGVPHVAIFDDEPDPDNEQPAPQPATSAP